MISLPIRLRLTDNAFIAFRESSHQTLSEWAKSFGWYYDANYPSIIVPGTEEALVYTLKFGPAQKVI